MPRVVLLILFSQQLCMGQLAGKPIQIPFLINREFDQQLEKSISASWEGTPIRTLLRRLSENRKVAIMLDRNIDPTIKPVIKLQQISLHKALWQIARQIGAEVSILENVVYIGPPKRAQVLRTLIQIRSDEIVGPDSQFSKGQQFDLVKLTSLQWNDLSQPAQVLHEILKKYHIPLDAPPGLPHDLWSAASLPPADLVQQLSLILIQFDMTFAWQPEGNAIKLVPVPRKVLIERTYSIKSKLAAQRLEPLIKQHQNWNWQVTDKTVTLRALMEQHDQVTQALRPSQAKPDPGKPPAPLNRQRFTLKLQNVSAAALFKKLEQSGVKLDYNTRLLNASGIDLNKKINMNVSQATAEEFFQQICNQLDLDFEISDHTVTLTPKK